jgi:hypothetical protein
MVSDVMNGGIALALCAILLGCGVKERTHARLRVLSNDELIAVAREYVKVHRSAWAEDLVGRPVVRDKGESWEVEFAPPEGTLGGGPAVLIDKKTAKPVKAYHYQ